MPASVCGGVVFNSLALNCRPWLRSFTHSPAASMYSPETTLESVPMTVTGSRCPGTATRRTTYPLSSLWNVMRSTTPESVSGVLNSACMGELNHIGPPVAMGVAARFGCGEPMRLVHST